MSEPTSETGFPEIDGAVEAALRAVPRPPARAEFREGLRRSFLSPAQATGRAAPVARSAAAPPPDASDRRSLFLRLGGFIAAGLILAIGFFVFQPALRWKVLDLAAGSVVKADGILVASGDRLALARALERAREIEVERGDLVLQVGDLSLFDLGEGTRVSLAGFDRSAPSAPYEVKVLAGRVRARTGPGFQGRTMHVAADAFDVTVTGTAFAVDYEAAGTCICCLHGEVQVSPKAPGTPTKPVPPECMCFVYRDERAPRWGNPPDKHSIPLKALEARAQEIWR